MARTPQTLMSYIRAIAGAWRDDPREDAELLERYVKSQDERAFATLMWRHGPLVWRSCTRVLGNGPDAEDAFQSVFLTMSRKAGMLRADTIAGWLYRVARQAALKVDARTRRCSHAEQRLKTATQSEVEDTNEADLRAGLEEELDKLPEKLQVPLLLHYLEGKSQVEVARILGCCRSTLQERLTKAESILRKRLERRGLTLGAVCISVGELMRNPAGAPAVPARMIESTARAAMAFRAGTLSGGTAETAKRLLHSLSLKGSQWKGWWVVLVGLSSLGVGGAGLLAWRMYEGGSNSMVPAGPVATVSETPEPKMIAGPHGKKVDCYGDPLPDGAIARIGTIRFRSGTHGESNGDVAFMSDGKTLVSVHSGNFVHFWEATTGRELRRLDVHATCLKVAISPDSKKLAVIGSEGPSGISGAVWVWTWDLTEEPPRRLWQYTLENGWYAVAFAPDSKTLAIASQGVRLFDVTSGAVRKTIMNKRKAAPLAYSPDGKTLATGGRLWDAATGAKQRELKELLDKDGKSMGEHFLAFSSDGKAFAASHWDTYGHSLHIWDVATGAVRCQVDGKRRDSFITFMPDGQTLMEAQGGVIRYWDSITGKKAGLSTDVTYRNLLHEVPHGMCLSPDSKLLAQADGMEVGLWDVATGHEVGPTEANRDMKALTLSPDSKTLVALTNDFAPRIWDAETGQPVRKLERFSRAVVAPFDYFDGRQVSLPVVEVNGLGSFVSYDVQTGKFSTDHSPVPPPSMRPTSYAVSPDGRWQLWGSPRELVLVDRSSGKEVCHFPGQENSSIRFMAVSGDGRSMLVYRHFSVKDDDQIEVWSAVTGKQRMIRSLETHIMGQPAAALSPDGRWLALVAGKIDRVRDRWESEPAIRLWEVASGTEGEKFKTDGAELCSIAWSPDGRLLVGGDINGDLWFWDMAAGSLHRHVTGHRGGVRVLVFSQDGLRLVSGSYDTTALVWDLHSLPHQDPKTNQLQSAGDLWEVLRSRDAAKARAAMHVLSRNPDISLPLLRERLQPTPVHDPKRVAALLTQLDDDDFQVRKQAEEQLEKMGEGIETVLQEALTKKLSLEVRKCINKVLDKILGPPISPCGMSLDQLRVCRGVEILERIGTPAARQVLEELSCLPAGLVQTEEAKSALQRMAHRMPISTP